MPNVIIDGRRIEFAATNKTPTTILEVARSAGIDIPTLCHDERLKPSAVCRMCTVDVKGHPHSVTACSTPVADGMEIETKTPELEEFRKSILRLLAESHPPHAAGQFPDKEFPRLLKAYGIEGKGKGAELAEPCDDSHPYIRVDMSQCIYCMRCVRICNELQGQFVWKVMNRGDRIRIVPDSGTTLLESTCVSCGACVDTCPTGALVDRSVADGGSAAKRTRTTCPYCGTGCEMIVGTRENRIVQIKPALDAPVSRGHLCAKGRYAFDFVHSADRVTEPMVKRHGEWKRVSWSDAIHAVAEALRRSIEEHGPDSVGILGSARATNEENYLAQKFARLVVGTNNVDCCARVCHAPTAVAMKAMLGTGAATNSYDDIEKTRLILLAGANATSNHPIVGARIKQAVLNGAKLVVIDPRKIELANYADIHLQLRPGTNVPLLNAIACAMIEENLIDRSFLEQWTTEWDEYRDFVSGFTPENVAHLCGVDAADIRKAARLYAGERPGMIVHGLGMTEHVQGTEGVMLLVNLALLTGNLGKPGAGVNPLRGQNNVQGSAHMGCEPKSLTGGVGIDEGRTLFERVWGRPLPKSAGLNLMEMVDAAARGKLKTLWAIGYDVLLTNPNAQFTHDVLWSLDDLIVQDMFMTETARELGTIFLPAASSFEKGGTFMNAERRIQRVRAAIHPVGSAKSDWEILCLAANEMGQGASFGYRDEEEIWNEIRTVWSAGAGISYSRLERDGLQWPCPNEDHPGTAILHTTAPPPERRIPLRRVDYRPSGERPSAGYPFAMITGRTLFHFNAGTMTLRTPNAELWPSDFLEIGAQDAGRLGLRDGERATVTSRYGEATLPVKISGAMRDGEVFASFHTPEVFLNYVTGTKRDNHAGTPEYKLTAVAVHKAQGDFQPASGNTGVAVENGPG